MRSSKNDRCVIFWLGAWYKLYPSLLLKYYVMGFSARVNNQCTEKESPRKIPVFTLLDRSSLYPCSYLYFQCDSPCIRRFMTDLMRCIRVLFIPYIFTVSSYYPLMEYRVKRFLHVHQLQVLLLEVCISYHFAS